MAEPYTFGFRTSVNPIVPPSIDNPFIGIKGDAGPCESHQRLVDNAWAGSSDVIKEAMYKQPTFADLVTELNQVASKVFTKSSVSQQDISLTNLCLEIVEPTETSVTSHELTEYIQSYMDSIVKNQLVTDQTVVVIKPQLQKEQGSVMKVSMTNININLIGQLADKQLNQELAEAGISNFLPAEMKAALEEELALERENATRNAAREIYNLLKAAESVQVQHLGTVREARRLERQAKNALVQINRAKEYGLETQNFLPLLALMGHPLPSGIDRSLAIIPDTFGLVVADIVPAKATKAPAPARAKNAIKKPTTSIKAPAKTAE